MENALTQAIARTPVPARIEPTSRRWLLAVGVYLLASVPLLLSLVSLPLLRYLPIGDDAATLFRLDQVGSSDTPLVGAYSTRGWAHPGPAHFFLLTPVYRLLGSGPLDMFAAALVLHLIALALAIGIAARRRGTVGVVLTGGTCAALLHGLHPYIYVQSWNPYLPLLLYFAFLMCAWSVAERDFVLLPLAVGLGSVVMQMHVAYVVLVGGAVLGVGTSLLLTRSSGSVDAGRGTEAGARARATSALTRRGALLTVGVGAVLWLAPALDLVFGEHNLVEIARYFAHGNDAVIGARMGLGIFSGYVSPDAWAAGQGHFGPFGIEARPLIALVLLAVTLLVVTVLGLRSRRSGPVGLVALSQLVAGALACGRVESPPLRYLIVWMLPLGAFCYLAVLDSGLALLRERAGRAAKGARLLIPVAGGVVGVLALIFTVLPAWTPELPNQETVPAVTSVTGQLHDAVRAGEPVRIEGVGDYFNKGWVGVLFDLARRDQNFFTTDGSRGQKWGVSHRWNGQRVATTITIATTLRDTYDDPVARCQSDRSVRQLAIWDPLTAGERVEFRQLLVQRYVLHGHAPPDAVTRFHQLSPRSLRLAVFEGPVVCGSP